MHDQNLIDQLIQRAEDDARAFRKQHPDDTPTERWIENSFTASYPLARDAAGAHPEAQQEAELFSVYRRAIAARLGERVSRRDEGDDLAQQPTPGEHG